MFPNTCNDRSQQIQHVASFLSPNGIVILTEKCNTSDYDHWENVKNINYKHRFFSEAQIEEKRANSVDEMMLNQVSIGQLLEIATRQFKVVTVFWNSCNFYSVACSNSGENIEVFLNSIGTSITTSKFVREEKLATDNTTKAF